MRVCRDYSTPAALCKERKRTMIVKKCTFDELPDAMQMHVLYCEKITVAEYRLAIWSNKDTLYYNGLPEKEVERFVSLIESGKST